ncbi:MAG: hypothetical protein LBD04_03500 [Synergistaceae bacterium]|jgi:hypothetical protein|nr:hypothetical protein [Synergistaceae bacterium]
MAKKRIGTILLKAGNLTASRLKEALAEQVDSREALGEILVEKGILRERQVIEALGKRLVLPVVELGGCSADASLLKLFSPNFLERRRVFPL